MLAQLKTLAEIKPDHTNSEIENAKAIIGYAHSLFAHNGDNMPSASDPLTILKEAQKGQSFRCVEYSILAAGLLWAHGIPARTIGLKTSDVETREYGAGHVVIEFWSRDLDKWVMSDVQAGLIVEYEDLPLSAYELKQCLDDKKPPNYIAVPHSSFNPDALYDGKPDYSDWIYEYLYYIDTPVSLTLGNEDRRKQRIVMLVPEGSPLPKTFQGMFEINAQYTHSSKNFYAKPFVEK